MDRETLRHQRWHRLWSEILVFLGLHRRRHAHHHHHHPHRLRYITAKLTKETSCSQ